MSSFLGRLRDSPPLLGTWVKLPATETVEILAHSGYDFIVVDREHSPLSLESAYRAISLGQALGLAVLVRVPDRTGSTVQRVLDAGADGILIPQVATPDIAATVTSQMVFSADGGSRGMGSTSRAGLWGLRPGADYLRRGRAEVARVVQIEDRAAFDQLEQILDVTTVNAALIGLGDLALSSGLPASGRVIQDLVDRFLAAARARDLPCGTAVPDAAAAIAAARRGFSFILVSNDASMFAHAARDQITSIRGGLAAPDRPP